MSFSKHISAYLFLFYFILCIFIFLFFIFFFLSIFILLYNTFCLLFFFPHCILTFVVCFPLLYQRHITPNLSYTWAMYIVHTYVYIHAQCICSLIYIKYIEMRSVHARDSCFTRKLVALDLVEWGAHSRIFLSLLFIYFVIFSFYFFIFFHHWSYLFSFLFSCIFLGEAIGQRFLGNESHVEHFKLLERAPTFILIGAR